MQRMGAHRKKGRCRHGYIIGLMLPSPSVPRHILQWASKFTHKLVETGLGGEVYAFGGMADHVALLKGFYAPSANISPGMAVLRGLRKLVNPSKEQEDGRREIFSSTFPWYLAGSRAWLAGKRVLDARIVGPCGWADKS